LRDHISKLREERKLAARLYENVLAMKRCSDPAAAYQYDPILRDIDQLEEYFQRMASFLAEVEDEAVRLSNKLGRMIDEDTDSTRRTTSGTFML